MSEVKTNKISSVSTNGDITLDPDGTGDVLVASGNVGIGTTSPAKSLSINTSSNTDGIDIGGGGTVYTSITSAGTDTTIQATNAFAINTNGANERLRIDSSGNVGIGTTVTGDAELIVYGDDAATIYKNSTTGTGGADGFYVGLGKSGGTAAYVYQRENTNLIFGTNDTERMRISQSGDLILGTTATIGPAQFNVDGGSQCAIGIRAGNGTSGYFNQVLFANNENSALIGSIQRVNNASVQYNTTSDARLKENIADMTGAITRVKQLAPKRYSWVNEDLDAADQDGFLAHEAQTVVPGAVSGTQDEVDGDGNPIYMQMDYSKLVPLLTSALKEAITKIEALEARVTALEDA